MYKIIITLLLTLCADSMIAQSSNAYVTLKDGYKMPKAEFVNSCVTGVEAMSGNIFDTESYCECSLDLIARYFTQSDLMQLMNGDKSSMENAYNVIFKGLPEQGMIELQQCMIGHLKDENKVVGSFTPEAKKAAIYSCEQEARLDSEFEQLVDVEGFCSCYIGEFIKYFSYADMLSPKEKDSPRIEKLMNECIMTNFK
ncbi:MAG: hypothetical protein KDD32_00385 [Bacteroidetes bacterium]|nr:hypothetical protein [Bacteroidota bacterium]